MNALFVVIMWSAFWFAAAIHSLGIRILWAENVLYKMADVTNWCFESMKHLFAKIARRAND